MKVLDLGSHDGYLGRWLSERFDGDVALYGMELHPDAAQKARERGYVHVVEAPAEEAPEHFEPGSFDAVLMFELIEHVPDMDRLLAAAERMLKPGGRVYVSTPDGTFGEGHNPHHLRALRASDLAELLRARGYLHGIEVGTDTVTVASYSPAPRYGRVAIHTGGGWMPWSPRDIEEKGLGGSETAAARLADQLATLGYIVTVYGEVEPGAYGQVVYRHHATFDPLERRDCLIASRVPELFDRPVAARVRLLWAHDTDVQDRLTVARLGRIDRIITLSRWHEAHFKGRYPFAASKVVRLRNGIHLPYFGTSST